MMYPSHMSGSGKPASGRLLVSIVLAIGVCLFLLAGYHAIGFTWDDPFISFRYAQNLAEGHGLVFNIGERIEGYSNLLYVLICALVYKLGLGRIELGLLYFSKVFGLVFAFGSIIIAWHFFRRWEYTVSIGYIPLALFAPWMLLTNIYFAGWAMGGMETVFFPFLLMAASFLLLQEIQQGRQFNQWISWPALLYWLAAMTRPEAPVMWFAPLVAILTVRKKYEIGGRLIISYVVTFIVLMAAFLLHRYLYFGDFLPNTYYAKATGGYEQIVNGLYNFTSMRSYAYIGNIIGMLLIFIPLCYPRIRNSFGFRLVFFQVFVYLLFIISSGKDWMGGYRFFVHILPLMAISASMGIIALFSRESGFVPSEGERPRCQRIWLLLIAILLIAPPVVLMLLFFYHPMEGKEVLIEPKQFELGLWFLFAVFVLETMRGKYRSKAKYTAASKVVLVMLALTLILWLNLDGTGWKPRSDNPSFLSAKVFEFESGFTRWPPPMMIEKYYVIGRWMHENLDTDGLLAIGEAGAIPYFSEQPIVDCFGLMDKTIARMPGTTFFDKSNSKEAADYILSREPKYFLFKGTFTPDKSYILPSWREFHYIQHVWVHPEFEVNYRLRHVYEDFIIYERNE